MNEIREHEWRVSRSGFSIRTGSADEKKMIATYPGKVSPLDTKQYAEWLDNANHICELHNAVQIRQCQHEYRREEELGRLVYYICGKCGATTTEYPADSRQGPRCKKHDVVDCLDCAVECLKALDTMAQPADSRQNLVEATGMVIDEYVDACVSADSRQKEPGPVETFLDDQNWLKDDPVGERLCIGCGKPHSQCKCPRYELAK